MGSTSLKIRKKGQLFLQRLRHTWSGASKKTGVMSKKFGRKSFDAWESYPENAVNENNVGMLDAQSSSFKKRAPLDGIKWGVSEPSENAVNKNNKDLPPSNGIQGDAPELSAELNFWKDRVMKNEQEIEKLKSQNAVLHEQLKFWKNGVMEKEQEIEKLKSRDAVPHGQLLSMKDLFGRKEENSELKRRKAVLHGELIFCKDRVMKKEQEIEKLESHLAQQNKKLNCFTDRVTEIEQTIEKPKSQHAWPNEENSNYDSEDEEEFYNKQKYYTLDLEQMQYEIQEMLKNNEKLRKAMSNPRNKDKAV